MLAHVHVLQRAGADGIRCRLLSLHDNCRLLSLHDVDVICSHMLVAEGEQADRLAHELLPESSFAGLRRVSICLDLLDTVAMQSHASVPGNPTRTAVFHFQNGPEREYSVRTDRIVFGRDL